MALRNVIAIDKERCTGCAECVNACVGGALQLVDGKARLVREDYCDGLGVCVGECPVGALKVEKQEAAKYERRGEGGRGGGGKVSSLKRTLPSASPPANACPGTGPRTLKRNAGEGCPGGAHVQIFPKPDGQVGPTGGPAMGPAGGAGGPSSLSHWPIQLHLVRPDAKQFRGADVLIAATCSAFAHGGFHPDLLSGRSLVIACPKLDNKAGYLEKLTDLFRHGGLASVTIARMEVPCCHGLTSMVVPAREAAQSDLPLAEVLIGLGGDTMSANQHLSVHKEISVRH